MGGALELMKILLSREELNSKAQDLQFQGHTRVPYFERAKDRTACDSAFIALAFTRECHVTSREECLLFSLKPHNSPEQLTVRSRVDAVWGMDASAYTSILLDFGFASKRVGRAPCLFLLFDRVDLRYPADLGIPLKTLLYGNSTS
jgi:hypothetical protein